MRCIWTGIEFYWFGWNTIAMETNFQCQNEFFCAAMVYNLGIGNGNFEVGIKWTIISESFWAEIYQNYILNRYISYFYFNYG